MKKDINEKIVYSINVRDIQEVSKQILERNLSKKEIALVENSIGAYIDWAQAIENAIREHVNEQVASKVRGI